MINISITEEQHVGIAADVLNSLAKDVLEVTDKSEVTGDLSVVFVDDTKIQELNNTYRGKDTPTDVLSFSYLDEDEEETVGEMIISVDTAKTQALEHQHELSTEIEVLFVHGLLHILGYDHENKKDKENMLMAEKAVLAEKAGLIERSEG